MRPIADPELAPQTACKRPAMFPTGRCYPPRALCRGGRPSRSIDPASAEFRRPVEVCGRVAANDTTWMAGHVMTWSTTTSSASMSKKSAPSTIPVSASSTILKNGRSARKSSWSVVRHVRRGGTYLRVADHSWRDPLSGERSRIRGGRWNAPGAFGVAYLNASRELARVASASAVTHTVISASCMAAITSAAGPSTRPSRLSGAPPRPPAGRRPRTARRRPRSSAPRSRPARTPRRWRRAARV